MLIWYPPPTTHTPFSLPFLCTTNVFHNIFIFFRHKINNSQAALLLNSLCIYHSSISSVFLFVLWLFSIVLQASHLVLMSPKNPHFPLACLPFMKSMKSRKVCSNVSLHITLSSYIIPTVTTFLSFLPPTFFAIILLLSVHLIICTVNASFVLSSRENFRMPAGDSFKVVFFLMHVRI